MNKLFIALTSLIFISFSHFAFAQEKMEIYNGQGTLIENGANMVTIAGSLSSKILNTDSLFIKNISEGDIKLKVRKINTNLVSGSFSVFTALAQNVPAEESMTANYWDLEVGMTTPIEAFFQGSYYPQNIIGTSGIIYSFLSVDEDDKVLDSVYVCYAFSNTSVTPMDANGEMLYHREVMLECNTTELHEYPINLHNHTTGMVSYRIAKTINQVEEGQEIFFKYGGQEYGHTDNASDANGVDIASDETLSGANGFIARFKANEIDANEFLPSVTYKFFNKLAGNDADYVTLLYNVTGVGFSELDAYDISSAYPNPAIDHFQVDHQLPAFNQANLKVYGSNGSLLAQFPIIQRDGTVKVEVSDFPSGIYLLSIEINGKSIGVEKIMVN